MITSATSHIRSDFRGNTVLHVLLGLYGIVWVITALHPVYPTDWLLENILVFLFVPALMVSYRYVALSDLSYIAITCFLSLHAVGAHYTYAEVPFGFWLRDALDLTRNHFDRIVHFSFGLFLAYPIREIFLRLVKTRGFWAYYFPLDVTLAFSALYEIIEMVVAKIVSADAGDAYLGTQGDPFDAVMDMASAGTGAFVCMVMVVVFRRVTKKGPYLLAGE